MTIDRRTLLQTLSGLAAWSLASRAAPALAQAGSTPAPVAFGRLSAALTGYPDPDPATADKVWRAFATPARRNALDALAALVAQTPPAELDAALRAQKLDLIANQLVAAWYSGVVTTDHGPQLVLYTDALVWKAMTYSKPMGVCGGATGYWANPPA
jgi:hypothetical protein